MRNQESNILKLMNKSFFGGGQIHKNWHMLHQQLFIMLILQIPMNNKLRLWIGIYNLYYCRSGALSSENPV